MACSVRDCFEPGCNACFVGGALKDLFWRHSNRSSASVHSICRAQIVVKASNKWIEQLYNATQPTP